MRPRATSRVDRTVLRIVFSCAVLAGPAAAARASAADGSVIVSHRARADFALTADPGAAPWKGVQGVVAEKDRFGKVVPHHRTEIRSRWTDKTLYLLYTCPYDELNLKPEPNPAVETPRLWNWDVAEAFIGSGADRMTRYKEFQVSPQSEWVDLDIDRDDPQGQAGMKWNSGYSVKGRVDARARIWYGAMRIPFAAIDTRLPQKGRELRIGLYRIAGVVPSRRFYAWRPTGQTSFHVPQAFGTLRLK